MILSCILFFGILFSPSLVHAEQTTVWSFQDGIPGRWDVTGLSSAVPTPEGLHIDTTTDGSLRRRSELDHPVEAITIIAQSARPTDALLYWHTRGTGEKQFVQLPFSIAGTGDWETIGIYVNRYPQWDRNADVIGLAFPAGSDVLIREVKLQHWSLMENMTEAWRSFWTFDTFYAYTINFLWGPLINGNPVARAQMYEALPAIGFSVNWLLLGLIVLAAIACRLRGSLRLFLLITLGLWVFYDIRMGLEVLSYAKTDYDLHFSKPPEEREFRERGNFYTILDQSLPFIQGSDRFAFLSPYREAFGMLRYAMYPSLPVFDAAQAGNVHTWLIYDRPDITTDADDRLTDGANVLSPPGKIVKRFTEDTFLFQTTL